MDLKLAALVSAVTLFSSGYASAAPVTLNFNDLNPSNTSVLFFFGPYVSQGFSVSSDLGFNTYGTGATSFYAGSSSLSPIIGAAVQLKATDNSAFAVNSISLARNFLFDPAPSVTFTGALASGGTVTQTFEVTTTAGAAAFQPFQFSGFSNITSLSWSQASDAAAGLHQFTDLNLDVGGSVPPPPPPPTVPEPGSLSLLAAGIGLAFVAHKRSRLYRQFFKR